MVAVSFGTLAALVALASGRLRRRRIGHASFDADSGTIPSPRVVGTAVAIGLVVALFVHPLAGVVAVIVTALERRLPPILDHLLVGLVALGYVYVLVQQTRYGTPVGFGWPDHYWKVHGLVFFAAVVYGARLTRDRYPSSGTIPHS